MSESRRCIGYPQSTLRLALVFVVFGVFLAFQNLAVGAIVDFVVVEAVVVVVALVDLVVFAVVVAFAAVVVFVAFVVFGVFGVFGVFVAVVDFVSESQRCNW